MNAAQEFFAWGNRYRDTLLIRQADDLEGAKRIERHVDSLWASLPPVLQRLAIEAEAVGVDSSPCHALSGVLTATLENPADDAIPMLDSVWSVAKRLQAIEAGRSKTRAGGEGDDGDDPWVPVRLGDLELNRKWVKDHADDPAKPFIQRLGRGKYEIRQSKLREYLRRPLWEKFGV